MAGTSFQVTLKGLPRVRNLLQSFAKAAGGDAELHRRWGIQGLNWVDQNFRQQGALTGTPWKGLSPNTVANRRQGSSNVLQDTGQLRASYGMTFSATETIIGTANPIAAFHESGSRAHTIKAKPGKSLVFKVAGGGSGKKGKRGSGNLVFAKEVRIPALPARRMLPRQEDATFMTRLIQTGLNYLRELGNKE